MVTDDGPPHMIAKTQSGIDVDIAKLALNNLGCKVSVTFAPLERGRRLVLDKQADLFLPTFYEPDKTGVFLSDAFIQYRPTFFTLKKKHAKLNHLSDIKNQRVATFQGATGYFGEVFVDMTKRNDYREIHDMSKLPELLIADRIDVVVLDYYIFYFYLRSYSQQREINRDLTTAINAFALIPPVSAYVGFHDKNLRDQFNQSLKIVLAQQQDQRIIEHYIGSLTH